MSPKQHVHHDTHFAIFVLASRYVAEIDTATIVVLLCWPGTNTRINISWGRVRTHYENIYVKHVPAILVAFTIPVRIVLVSVQLRLYPLAYIAQMFLGHSL